MSPSSYPVGSSYLISPFMHSFSNDAPLLPLLFLYPSSAQEYVRAGTVEKHYITILTMLLRLRQACNHPALISPLPSSSSSSSSSLSSSSLPLGRAASLPPTLRERLRGHLHANHDDMLCVICQVSALLPPQVLSV